MPGKKKKSTASRKNKKPRCPNGTVGGKRGADCLKNPRKTPLYKSTGGRRRSSSSSGRKKCPEHGRNRNYKKKVVCRKNKRRSAIPREKPCKNGVVKGKPGAPCLEHPREVPLKTQRKKRKSTAAKRKRKRK